MRRQWAVGQGFFHTAEITADSSRSVLRYVYDCGATAAYDSALARDVTSYRGVLGGNLDLLFLSHMHHDHVGGVDRLLASAGGGPKVDTVVLPMVDDVERIIAFAAMLVWDAPSGQRDFYRDLMVNPVEALGRFSPRRVILVRSGRGDGGGGGVPFGEFPQPPFQGPEGEPLDPIKGEGWRIVGYGPVRRQRAVPGASSSSQANGVFVMPDTDAILVGDPTAAPWLLAPFLDPMVRQEKDTFLDALARELGSGRNEAERRIADPARRRVLLVDNRAELRRAYDALKGNLNLTSLALLSAPATQRPSSGQWHLQGEKRSMVGNWARDGGPARVGWLGTGDAHFGDDKRRGAFLRHFRPHLGKVHTLTLPHHGAEKNFHGELLTAVEPLLCTVAADKTKDWRHPASTVVQSVASAGVDLRPVTSATPSALTEQLVVEWA